MFARLALVGFQLYRTLHGGTCSGMETLLIWMVREEYFDHIQETLSIIPSPKMSDSVVQQYNAVLSFHHLVENAHERILLNNELLYDIVFRTLNLTTLIHVDVSHFMSAPMVGMGTII